MRRGDIARRLKSLHRLHKLEVRESGREALGREFQDEFPVSVVRVEANGCEQCEVISSASLDEKAMFVEEVISAEVVNISTYAVW